MVGIASSLAKRVAESMRQRAQAYQQGERPQNMFQVYRASRPRPKRLIDRLQQRWASRHTAR
jgi:hypothetical protein